MKQLYGPREFDLNQIKIGNNYTREFDLNQIKIGNNYTREFDLNQIKIGNNYMAHALAILTPIATTFCGA